MQVFFKLVVFDFVIFLFLCCDVAGKRRHLVVVQYILKEVVFLVKELF